MGWWGSAGISWRGLTGAHLRNAHLPPSCAQLLRSLSLWAAFPPPDPSAWLGPLPAGWTQGSCTFYLEAGSRVQKTEVTGLVRGCALYQPCHFLYFAGQSRLPWWLSGKESTCQCRRHRFGPSARKSPWRSSGRPLQYSCLGNPMDRGAWWPIVHGVERVRNNLATK